MTVLAQPLEQDERVVEEVHCSECGSPITSIPAWYAKVAVKFSCDTCRQKSPRLAAAIPNAELDAPRVPGVVDGELDSEPALEDIDVDDIEIEDGDLEVADE